MSSVRAWRRAAVAGVGLAVVLSVPVAAKDADGVHEAVNVRESLTVVIDPASVNYGDVDQGATSDSVLITATITASGSGGWTLSADGTPFTTKHDQMPASVRSVRVDGAGDWIQLGHHTRLATGDGSGAVTMAWRVTIPDGQAAGAYRGSLTFVVSGGH